MPAQTANGGTVPVGGDGWNLTADLKKLAETLRVFIPVADSTARDGLAALFPGGVLPVPTVAFRLDLARAEVWDGLAWKAFGAKAGAGPYAMAAGTASWTTAGSGNTTTITFPSGRFSAAPIVSLGKAQSAQAKANFYVVSVTTTGATIGVQAGDGGTLGSVGVATYWTAVQMTPTTGDG